MKTINVKQLTNENFTEYGTYTDLLNPLHPLREKGQPQFYPDRAVVHLGGNRAAISVSLEEKRPEKIIEFAEIHHNTEEGMLCLDDDMIIYCAPATETEEVPFDYMEAFFVPKGTLVTLRMGVWHGSQFLVNLENAHVMIILPERTYANDCVCVFFDDNEKIKVEMK